MRGWMRGCFVLFFFFKQKTAYEMRISDWSSDVCSSDLYRKAPKRKGGRVYVEVRSNGEVIFHEGYVTSKEAKRLERGLGLDSGPKAPRPEVTGPTQTYIDLHRHAAVRAALCHPPKVPRRLMFAHAIVPRTSAA